MTPPIDDAVAALVDALGSVARGNIAEARASAARSADAGSELGRLLELALAGTDGTDGTAGPDGPDGGVYDDPDGFSAFIRGGGNVALYAATSSALSGLYRRLKPDSLLEIGPGNGHALLPALDGAGADFPGSITLAEPSAALFAACHAALLDRGWATDPDGPQSVRALLDAAGTRRWDLTESTFALHALPREDRSAMLRDLAGRTGRLALVEFDVDLPAPGTRDHLVELATRYAQGLSEYHDDRELVGSGFLVPVLIGQLQPGAVRSTWEQPASAWAAQVRAAGFADVQLTPLADYWWSPAFLLTAVGRG